MKSKKLLPLALLPVSIALLSNTAVAGQCDVAFEMVNNWGSGGQVNLNVKNTGAPVSNWNVCWTFANGETIADLWNGVASARSGSVCVSDRGWNGALATNAQAQVGIILNGLNGVLPTQFTLNGESCGDAPAVSSQASVTSVSSIAAASSSSLPQASSSSVALVSSSASSLVTVSSSSDASLVSSVSSAAESSVSSSVSSAVAPIVYQGPWLLDSDDSAIHVVATSNSDVAQTLTFAGVDASVAIDGSLNLAIPLAQLVAASTAQANALQEYFLADHLPHAFFSAQLNWAEIDALTVGSVSEHLVQGQLSLHAVTIPVATRVRVVKHSDARISVVSREPLVIDTQSFDLSAGLSALAELAGLETIGASVPVYVSLELNRAENASAPLITLPSVPQAPIGLQADVSLATGDVDLHWSDIANNETAYIIRRQGVTGEWVTQSVKAADTESFWENLYASPGSYNYKVIAVNAGVPASSPASATVSYALPQSSAASSEMLVSSSASSDLAVSSSASVVESSLSSTSSSESSSVSSVVVSSSLASSSFVSSSLASSEVSSSEISSSESSVSESSSSESSVSVSSASSDSSSSSSSTPVITEPDYYSCNNDTPAFGERVVRRLSQKEYANTVRDLFGYTADLSSTLPADVKSGYFPNAINVALNIADRAQYSNAANAVVNYAGSRWNQILGCDLEAHCFDTFVEDFLPWVLRRPLTIDEQIAYQSLAAEENAKSLALRQALNSEAFLYRSEMGEEVGNGVYRLSDYELASFLSYTYLGTTPSQALFADAAAGNLQSDAGVRHAAEALLADESVHARLGDLVLDWIDAQNIHTKDTVDIPLSWMPIYGPHIKEATARDFSYGMIGADQSFANLYHPTYVWTNIILGNMWGLTVMGDVQTGGEFSFEYAFDRRGGIVGSGAFATRFSRFDPVINQYKGASIAGRAAAIRERILCEDVPSQPANESARIAQIKASNEAFYNNELISYRERYEQMTSASDCRACHNKLLNPLGFGLEAINEVGSVVYTDVHANWLSRDGILYGYGGENGVTFSNSMRGLTNILANHPDVAPTTKSCLATQVMSYTSGIATKQLLNHQLPAGVTPIDAQLRTAARCDIYRMTETLSDLSPREMLLQLPTLQSVLYRKSY